MFGTCINYVSVLSKALPNEDVAWCFINVGTIYCVELYSAAALLPGRGILRRLSLCDRSFEENSLQFG